MKRIVRKTLKGFTLIEMLLVMVVVSMLIYGSLLYYQQRTLQSRIDRTTAQMQQILNASLSYYLMNGAWPSPGTNHNSLQCLMGGGSSPCSIGFIPTNITNPWGGLPYTALPDPTTSAVFYVWTVVSTGSGTGPGTGSALAIAESIAGNLPMAYVSAVSQVSGVPPDATKPCTSVATQCSVTASVNIPGDNLNNARAVNFSGLYRSGGCVPVPKCPVDYTTGYQMTPQIFVVPVSVSGFNDNGQNATNVNDVYPISSFTAYATGGPGSGSNPGSCSPNTSQNGNAESGCGGTMAANTDYWRACLQVVTEKGPLNTSSRPDWGAHVTVMAITRCAVSNEDAGSSFTVYQ